MSNLTLATYEANIDKYVAVTPQVVDGNFKTWVDRSLTYLSPGDQVLELGSAFGRDADYIESQGFSVRRTDVAEGFVRLLRNQGKQADILDAVNGDFGTDYDMVFVSAVLLHLNDEEFGKALDNSHRALKTKGILAFSVKMGEGEEISNDRLDAPRYFNYWQPEELGNELDAHGFEVLELDGGASDSLRQYVSWIYVIART